MAVAPFLAKIEIRLVYVTQLDAIEEHKSASGWGLFSFESGADTMILVDMKKPCSGNPQGFASSLGYDHTCVSLCKNAKFPVRVVLRA